MFSGIVQAIGVVEDSTPGRLTIAAPLVEMLAPGESVAVNGVCLSVATSGEHAFTADVMPETLRCTNLGALAQGRRVNLERALTLADVVGGHLVTGHVDLTGVVERCDEQGNARVIDIAAPAGFLELTAAKGSVAVDGISLTVVAVSASGFRVSVIPHTLQETVAGEWDVGSRVNLEADMIARYVQRLLRQRSS